MSAEETRPDPQAVKACCADLYSRDGIRLILGETLHPGNLALTARLAKLLGLTNRARVLDVGAGPGASAHYLARTLGCRVAGLDLSHANLARAVRRVSEWGVAGAVALSVGDAAALPYREGVFDAVVAECAFSTFPEKERVARELFRVLAPGGRLGLADVTIQPGALPGEWSGMLMQAACLADARPVEGYQGILAEAGFKRFSSEAHREALSSLLGMVRRHLLLGHLAGWARQPPFPGLDLGMAESIVEGAARLVRNGALGYVLLIAQRPHER